MRTRLVATSCAPLALTWATLLTAQVAPPPQAPPSTKGVVAKGRAPVSDEVLRVKLPRPQTATLSNGLHLMVLEDRRVPRITFQLLIPGAGGYYDPEDLPGLASITSSMMREGTASRSSLQLSEALETMAATLVVGTGMSATDATVSGSCLTEHAGQLFELFADLLLNPSFPEDELARYTQRTRATLLQQRANPGFLGSEMFAKIMYGRHPGGRLAVGIEALDTVTRAALVEFHRSRYIPDHAALAIAGDISPADARALVETRLAGWKKRGAPASLVAEPPSPADSRVTLLARPGSVQTSLIVGTPAISRTDPAYDVLQVMNKVIGGGPTGRLFLTLREEKSYTYGAYSGLSAPHWRGAWQASTDVRSEVTGDALRDLLAEVARLRDETVPEGEFRNHKRAMVGSFALSLESPQQMIGYYVTSWRFRLPADYWDRYPERIEAVTREQVQSAARKYLDPSRLQIVAVGELDKVRQSLESFGRLELYDTEGKRLSEDQSR